MRSDEAVPVEELHHHVAIAVGQVAQIEHLDDVLGADASGRLGFALEALHRVLVLGHAARAAP